MEPPPLKKAGVSVLIPGFLAVFLYIGVSCTVVGVPMLYLQTRSSRVVYLAVLIPVMSLLGAVINLFIISMPLRGILNVMIHTSREARERYGFIEADVNRWVKYLEDLRHFAAEQQRRQKSLATVGGGGTESQPPRLQNRNSPSRHNSDDHPLPLQSPPQRPLVELQPLTSSDRFNDGVFSSLGSPMRGGAPPPLFAQLPIPTHTWGASATPSLRAGPTVGGAAAGGSPGGGGVAAAAAAARAASVNTDAPDGAAGSGEPPVMPLLSVEHHGRWLAGQVELLDREYPSQTVIFTAGLQRRVLRELLMSLVQLECTTFKGVEKVLQRVTEDVTAMADDVGAGTGGASTTNSVNGWHSTASPRMSGLREARSPTALPAPVSCPPLPPPPQAHRASEYSLFSEAVHLPALEGQHTDPAVNVSMPVFTPLLSQHSGQRAAPQRPTIALPAARRTESGGGGAARAASPLGPETPLRDTTSQGTSTQRTGGAFRNVPVPTRPPPAAADVDDPRARAGAHSLTVDAVAALPSEDEGERVVRYTTAAAPAARLVLSTTAVSTLTSSSSLLAPKRGEKSAAAVSSDSTTSASLASVDEPVLSPRSTTARRSTAPVSTATLTPAAVAHSLVLQRGLRFPSDGPNVFLTMRCHRPLSNGKTETTIYAVEAALAPPHSFTDRGGGDASAGGAPLFVPCDGSRPPYHIFYVPQPGKAERGATPQRRALTIAEDRLLGMDFLGVEAPAPPLMLGDDVGVDGSGPGGMSAGSKGKGGGLNLMSLAVPVTPHDSGVLPAQPHEQPVTPLAVRQQYAGGGGGHSPPPGSELTPDAGDSFLLSWRPLPDLAIRLTTLFLSVAESATKPPRTAHLPVAECLVQDVLCVLTSVDVYLGRGGGGASRAQRVVLHGLSLEDVSASASFAFSTPRGQRQTSQQNGSSPTPPPPPPRQHSTVGELRLQEFHLGS